MLSVAILAAGLCATGATTPPDALERFVGVWLGRDLVMRTGPHGGASIRRRFDLAVRAAGAGFVVTWSGLGQDEAGRATLRFRPSATRGRFETLDAPGPGTGSARAEVGADRLTIELRAGERVARYVWVVNDRLMSVDYTLWREDQPVESATGTLHRAKVVM